MLHFVVIKLTFTFKRQGEGTVKVKKIAIDFSFLPISHGNGLVLYFNALVAHKT